MHHPPSCATVQFKVSAGNAALLIGSSPKLVGAFRRQTLVKLRVSLHVCSLGAARFGTAGLGDAGCGSVGRGLTVRLNAGPSCFTALHLVAGRSIKDRS
jgi:hypothetical protein